MEGYQRLKSCLDTKPVTRFQNHRRRHIMSDFGCDLELNQGRPSP